MHPTKPCWSQTLLDPWSGLWEYCTCSVNRWTLLTEICTDSFKPGLISANGTKGQSKLRMYSVALKVTLLYFHVVHQCVDAWWLSLFYLGKCMVWSKNILTGCLSDTDEPVVINGSLQLVNYREREHLWPWLNPSSVWMLCQNYLTRYKTVQKSVQHYK